jgi:hypothetical protein
MATDPRKQGIAAPEGIMHERDGGGSSQRSSDEGPQTIMPPSLSIRRAKIDDDLFRVPSAETDAGE